MDANRFDAFARALGGSRRRLIVRLSGLALSALPPLLGLADIEADKKKKKRKKQQGCPEGSFECPDGTCVPSRSSPGSRNCCHGEPCGRCGVCVNGRCAEVPEICDDAQCEVCNPVHWSCESRCGAGGTCCNGACQNPDLGPWQDCGGFCCPRETTCCGSGISGICCTASSSVCTEPCGNLPHACCHPDSLANGQCCGNPDGGGG